MKIIMFYQSLLSDWNHGSAHFLRGVIHNLLKLKHEVIVYEPKNSWVYNDLINEKGENALSGLKQVYFNQRSVFYDANLIDLDLELKNADLVIVHEWTEDSLISKLGKHRKSSSHYRILFHDSHHRAVTEPRSLNNIGLQNYDGILAFGEKLCKIYRQNNWNKNIWPWLEAADTDVFFPKNTKNKYDIVWIGNWGNDERSDDISNYFIKPVSKLKLRAAVFGVRYPEKVIRSFYKLGIEYGGWLPNYEVPNVFGSSNLTIHIPRAPYQNELNGIPNIRIFEALACKVPLINVKWKDVEVLFDYGINFLTAFDDIEIIDKIKLLLNDKLLRAEVTENGYRNILKTHNCFVRTKELLTIYEQIR